MVDVDQPLRLAGMQQQVRHAEELLRGEAFPTVIQGMFAEMTGALEASEVARLERTRSPRQDVALGVWRPLLEEAPEHLAQFVTELTAVPARVPHLVVAGLDPGPGYAEWLRQTVPHAVHEVWGPPTHHPHLAAPARFAARVEALAR